MILAAVLACGGGSSEPQIQVPRDRLESEQALERGKELYDQYCALCHGEDGNGHGPRQSSLTTQPRDFRSPAFDLGPAEIFQSLETGVPGTAMPSFKALSEEQRWDVTAYVVHLAEM